jgi:hypothetical protein
MNKYINLLFEGKIRSFIYLYIFFLTSTSLTGQIVNFKAESYYNDNINSYYKLKIDSIKIYNYANKQESTIFDYNIIDLGSSTSVTNNTFHNDAIRIRYCDHKSLVIDINSNQQTNSRLTLYNLTGSVIISDDIFLNRAERI